MKNKVFTLFFIALITCSAKGPDTIDDAAEKAWVNAIFETMTDEERLAQLIMIRAHSDKGPEHIAQVEKLIKDYQVGGLCFFQGTPEKQIELLNRYQQMAKIPMMVAMDAEWGLGMRMKASTVSFPRQLMLGAIQDNHLIYEMGREVARQCRRVGVQINFAPVADVNNNPENPVINTRSFGEDRYNVAAKSYMYMQGMQDGQVMACAKHFPGHGDTDVDSHYDLPVITHNRSRLDSVELFPFRVLAEHGIQSMMIAHLQVPEIDSSANRPTTLSSKAVDQLLKEQIGYKGLIFTDGLGMKGVTKHYDPGQVEAEALLAGNDILLLPEDIPATFKTIKAYLADGRLNMADLNVRVKKVLAAKYHLGLSSFEPIAQANVRAELNAPSVQVLKRQLIENAITLVRNGDGLLPISDLPGRSIASLSMGAKGRTVFQNTLDHYAPMEHFQAPKQLGSAQSTKLIGQLSAKDLVIVGLHDMDSRAAKNFGLDKNQLAFIDALRKNTKVILVVFGNPYSLKYFDELDCVLEVYEENEMSQDLAAQALFGAFSIRGRLPVTASPRSRFNDGVTTSPAFRLQYGLPESVGLNSDKLNEIDALAQQAISTRATPGCVVLVAKDGKVVFNKAYGHHTYRRRTPMQTDDLFDLASITKIAAATLSVMQLHEQSKISIYRPLSEYLPALKGSNKEPLLIKDIMAHRAGLHPWIPFFEQTVSKSRRNPQPLRKFYSKKKKEGFEIPVTEKLFMRNDFADSIWQQIYRSELRPTTDYKYSDLGFYLLGDMVGQVSGLPLQDYVQQNIYQPLGLSTATFNPHEKVSRSSVVPTEEDKYFRRQRVQGYVHDMGAAMLGGVSGHAGLFSNANDLAILMQLLLNGGYYGGQQLLQPETVRTFTTRHPSDTRRGIGFDMKELSPSRNANLSDKAAAGTFGHLGFTGTCVWADPENNIIFVFLSNRTYPSMKNFKLSKEDYRPKMQSIIYEAMQY
ncbi:MAG: glycoside hydrolase family 3 N-terminal domain-containing protein [Bacteroidota bacterium]